MSKESALAEMVEVSLCPACQQKMGKAWRLVKGWNLDKCRSCGMIYANPAPSEKALQRAYALPEKEYNEFFQSGYIDTKTILGGNASWQRKVSNNYLDAIEKLLPARGRMFEIGCGSGIFLEEAQRRGWETTGVDLGDWRADPERDRKLNIYNGTLFDVPSTAGSFDVVFMAALLEHLQDPWRHMDAIYKLLKPGGMIYMTSLPNINSWTIRLGVDKWIGNHPPAHLLYFNHRTVKLVLRRAGFKKIRVRSYGMSETILEAVFNQKKQKYSGSYAGYVYESSIKGMGVRICRALVYAFLNLTGTGSVLEVMGEK